MHNELHLATVLVYGRNRYIFFGSYVTCFIILSHFAFLCTECKSLSSLVVDDSDVI